MDINDLFRRIKYSIKQIPSVLKNEIKETDFSGTINNVINNKKNQKILIGVSIFLFSLFLLFLLNNYMSKLDGPQVKNLKLENSIYGEITYSGEISNRKIIGDGLLTIIGNKWAIEYNGTFSKSEKIDDSRDIQIGDFTKGTMKIVSLDSGNTYIFNGTFEDGFLKNGYIEKNINGAIIKYSGSFINNKLNGSGEKYIMINGESKTFKGVFEDNKLKSRSI